MAPSSTGVRRTRRTPPSTLARSGDEPPTESRPARRNSNADEGEGRQRRRHGVDELRVDREQQAADRRPDDHRRLEHDRPQRERPHEDLARDERRRQRPRGGSTERRRDAGAEREHEERPCRSGSGPGDEEQPDHDGHVERGRDREQRPPRKAIRQVTGRQGEERQRDEHRQPDEPEVERIAVNRVDLPADRDERHLDREPRREHDAEEDNEIAVPKRRVAARGVGRSWSTPPRLPCRRPARASAGTRPRSAGSASPRRRAP